MTIRTAKNAGREFSGAAGLREFLGGNLAGTAAVYASKTGSGMIARGLAVGRFVVGLCVGHTLVDALENLPLGESGVFQAADFRAAQRSPPLQSSMQNQIDCGIGKSHQPEHDGVAADDIQLIRFRDLQNHGLAVARACEVDCGVGARECVLAYVRFGNQRYASIVTDARLLQLYELRDFHIRSVQCLELLDVAGPHPRLVERTIVREQMLVASADPEEDENPEKHELVPHNSIVTAATRKPGNCAVRDTRAKGQVAETGRLVPGEEESPRLMNLRGARCGLRARIIIFF